MKYGEAILGGGQVWRIWCGWRSRSKTNSYNLAIVFNDLFSRRIVWMDFAPGGCWVFGRFGWLSPPAHHCTTGVCRFNPLVKWWNNILSCLLLVNSDTQLLESSISCCFCSVVKQHGTLLEQIFFMSNFSCQIVNTFPVDMFNHLGSKWIGTTRYVLTTKVMAYLRLRAGGHRLSWSWICIFLGRI